MPDFSRRSTQKELLDRDDIPFSAIRLNMRELEFINKWLGGHAITISGLKSIVDNTYQPSKQWTICEIGCGGGDNLKAIYGWCKKRKITARLIGIDINNDCIEYARENCSGLAGFEWISSDYRDIDFSAQGVYPDIIFSSLFCHHFTDGELVEQIQWMHRSRSGFFINDLHRNFLAYYSIKWLTRLFSRSYLVRNDAPLSVARGFSRADLVLLLRKAGISKFDLKWKWAFRWLVVAKT